jgi:hypothetical protein
LQIIGETGGHIRQQYPTEAADIDAYLHRGRGAQDVTNALGEKFLKASVLLRLELG